jgi:hypothetical protein
MPLAALGLQVEGVPSTRGHEPVNATTSRAYCRVRRRGLAPLELVAALPLLLIVMALMVVYGHSATWKVRGLSAARDAAWRARSPRHWNIVPPPANWQPEQARTGRDAGPALQQGVDPQLEQHEVARGPQIGTFKVYRDVLDPTRGVLLGEARLRQRYPMLRPMGPLQYDLEHEVLNDQFRYWEMRLPNTVHRRIPTLYELPRVGGLSQAFIAAAGEILRVAQQGGLAPLDRDAEIRYYLGHYVDFHPRVAHFCGLDAESVREVQVQRLIDRIQGSQSRPSRPGTPNLAETMTQFHIDMYDRLINQLQAQLNDPSTPPSQYPAIQQQINALQQRKQPYEDFLPRARQGRAP